MAALEEQGLLSAPHASAGRIPTEQGYRFFVDALTAPRALSATQVSALRQILESAHSVEDMIEAATRTLAHLTHQVALIQYPTRNAGTLLHLEFVPLDSRTLLALLISDLGTIHRVTVILPETTALAHDETVSALAAIKENLLKMLQGLPFENISALLPEAHHPALQGRSPSTKSRRLLGEHSSHFGCARRTSYAASRAVSRIGSRSRVQCKDRSREYGASASRSFYCHW